MFLKFTIFFIKFIKHFQFKVLAINNAFTIEEKFRKKN